MKALIFSLSTFVTSTVYGTPVEAPRPVSFFSVQDQTTWYNTRWGWLKGSVIDSRGVEWSLNLRHGHYSAMCLDPSRL